MLKQKTVYFREEDLPLWEAIENKAQWLHEALAASRPVSTDPSLVAAVKQNYTPGALVEVFAPRPPDPSKGFPCCQLKRPCKHWSYDGTNEVWVNSVTGKTKTVA